MLEASVQRQGMIGGEARKIQVSVSPPLIAQVYMFQRAVSVTCTESLAPAGIDLLGSHTGLIGKIKSVFQQLIKPGRLVHLVKVRIDLCNPYGVRFCYFTGVEFI